MSEELDAAERLRAASDPITPAAMLADLAYDYPEIRAAIAGNPTTYEGLLQWLGELDDPDVDAALAVRERGVTDANDANVLRVVDAPHDSLPSAGAPVAVDPSPTERLAPVVEDSPAKSSTWPAFLTRRFVAITAGIAAVAVIAIVVVVSVHNDSQGQLSAAAIRAQQAAADKANAANAKDTGDSHSATPRPTVTTTPTPVPPPSIVPSGFTQTWSQGFVGTGGYAETVAISVGNPEKVGSTYPRQVSTGTCTDPLGAGCTSTTFTSGKTCTASKATDAVVPLSVDITSTTSAFSQVVGARLQFQSNSRLQYEAYYESGLQCNDGSSGILTESGISTKPVKNGAGTSLAMFLIIANYYSPDHPNGNPSLLEDTLIYVSGDSTTTVGWSPDGKPVIHQNGDAPSTTLPSGSALRLG